MQNELRAADTHFEFGRNWSDFSSRIAETEIAEAEKGLLRLIPPDALRGASFLDIGSGSGLHSLAAYRLGAAAITAVDIDKDSVETTRRVLAKFEVPARVEQRSIFEADDLGEYDIVYSWGVLHHTGDMWAAVRHAAMHVRSGGLFVIALYQKTPLCGAWAWEKRLYTASPGPVRSVLSSLFGAAKFVALPLLGHNPISYVRNYRSARGMSYWHDVHDWLGGYPYESSTPGETRDFVASLGFEPVTIGDLSPGMGVFGTGCAEYVFRRK